MAGVEQIDIRDRVLWFIDSSASDLTHKERDALLLRFYVGGPHHLLPYSEIAREMSTSQSAARHAVLRGVNKFLRTDPAEIILEGPLPARFRGLLETLARETEELETRLDSYLLNQAKQ